MVEMMSSDRRTNELWVQSQENTMIKWINSKLAVENPEVPQFTTKPISSLADLKSGLELIKLANQIVFEILSQETHHPLHNSRLYYLNPTYTKPNFKLQKVENLNEFLQFARLILNINVQFISSENLMDGNTKLVLGLVWSLFLMNNSTGVANSFVELKGILLSWLHELDIKVTGFIWESPIEILSSILKYYIPEERESERGQDSDFLQYVSETYHIPRLVDSEDFKDEKCVVTYLVEWYKCFAVGTEFRQSSKYNSSVELVVSTVRLKNRYETCALRFINRCNNYLSSPSEDLLHDLTTKDYPQIQGYFDLISANLDQVDVMYYPSIKALNFENITTKFSQVSGVPQPNTDQPHTPTTQVTKAEFSKFLKLLVEMPSEVNHFELHKLFRAQIITQDMTATKFEAFIKLIPKRASSPNLDQDFKLSTSSSFSSFDDSEDGEHFIFDDIQQRVDCQLSGNFDKVYDLGGFVGGLLGGFHV